MTPHAVLVLLLDRLSARQGTAVRIGGDELDSWPAGAVAAMRGAGLLAKAEPAFAIMCPGCVRQCFKRVEVLPHEDSRPARIFIECNEPEDMGRIEVNPHALERWQITGEALASALSCMLGLLQVPQRDSGKLWTLGSLKGERRRADVKLAIEDSVALRVAGHTVPLSGIVRLDGDKLFADTSELLRLVDEPADESETESAEQRRARLRARIQDLRARRVRDFLQRVAAEEGISVSRLKQITSRRDVPANASSLTARPKTTASSKDIKPKR